jgi:NADH dehydrogenase
VVTEAGELEAANILWGAGVEASPLVRDLGIDADKAGRLKVRPDLSLPGHPEVFAVGDLVHLVQDNAPLPAVAPVAMQMARHVASLLETEVRHGGRAPEQRPAFRYVDKGLMATVGRKAAVARVGRFKLSGLPAWLAWLGVHLLFLIGFRNKLVVLIQWFYSYVTFRRGARIIFGGTTETSRFRLRPARSSSNGAAAAGAAASDG